MTDTARAARLQAEEVPYGPAHPLGGFLDLAVPEMGVAERHARVGMTEQA